MIPRKKTCYYPQENRKPFAVHHADYGIFSELRITNIGQESVVTALVVNDEFHPGMEVGGKNWFRPLRFPKRLRFGASLGVVLQGPHGYIEVKDCYGDYPRKLTLLLANGERVTYGLWDIVRNKA